MRGQQLCRCDTQPELGLLGVPSTFTLILLAAGAYAAYRYAPRAKAKAEAYLRERIEEIVRDAVAQVQVPR